jgi:hypothetical protein
MARQTVSSDTIIAEIRWILLMQGFNTPLPEPRPLNERDGSANWTLDLGTIPRDALDALRFAIGVAKNRYDLEA